MSDYEDNIIVKNENYLEYVDYNSSDDEYSDDEEFVIEKEEDLDELVEASKPDWYSLLYLPIPPPWTAPEETEENGGEPDLYPWEYTMQSRIDYYNSLTERVKNKQYITPEEYEDFIRWGNRSK